MTTDSRRAFLGTVSTAVPALAIVGGAAAVADAATTSGKRKVIPARPGAPFSRAAGVGDVVFVAGVVGRAPGVSDVASMSFEAQCRQAMENLKASVEAAGSSLSQVLKCGCFLTEVDDFPVMNKLFREYFPKDPPARSTVVVKELVVAGARIEIDCVTAIS